MKRPSASSIRPFVASILLATATPLTAQWLTLETPGIPRTADGAPDLEAPAPRTADGHPDLSGIWVPRGVSGDLYDPTKVQPWLRALMTERERIFYEDNPRFACLPSGPADLTLGGPYGYRRIVQSPTMIVFLHAEMTYRQIFMDGRELEESPLPTWRGYSVGRWDGDTLIVESNGYNDKTWLHRRGLGHTEQLRITERYQRTSFGRIRVDITYEDPGAYEAPLEAVIEMQLIVDDELLETVCAEVPVPVTERGGEIGEAEAKVVEVDPEILARYVGTYEGIWLANLITVEITLEDGVLAMKRNGSDARLIALSDTTFESSNGFGYIFTAEDGKPAGQVSEVHVSGAWPFERVE